jgi:tetratricopeptide (TPR) repeat protein
MWLKGSSKGTVAAVGVSLAERFVSTASQPVAETRNEAPDRTVQLKSFLAQVDREVHTLQLGLFRRIKLANSFKSRLLDSGVEPELAHDLTKILLSRLSARATASAPVESTFTKLAPLAGSGDIQSLMAHAAACGARGAHDEAAEVYRKVLELEPGHPLAVNNFGVALYKLGRFSEALAQFRQAVGLQSSYADAQFNLGTVLRNTGQVFESEKPLRRAVGLNPNHVEARVSLGLTRVMLGRLPDAKKCFETVLQVSPQNVGALCGIGQIASLDGRFGEAEALFKRALALDPRMPTAWAALAGVRKMTAADASWLKSAEEIAASGIAPLDEADLRFAIGKYYDDVGKFDLAFPSYQRANDMQKRAAAPYDPQARTCFVDEIIRAYPPETTRDRHSGASDSEVPVFVTGMMRSGTSLVEQIISSHPAARGSGELPFWNDVVRKYPDVIRNRWLAEPLRKKLAGSYLRTLQSPAQQARQALRVVDKSTFNSDYLGLIHAVFPRARIVYLRRDPLDTCLSCYFHQFSTAHNFTMDLADLAHYYREHLRLVAYWKRVLPSATVLEVPYAELVADQEGWTRRIVDFIGLEWDERCLDYHATQRPVLTASFWQVRQKIYKSSIGRWRSYEKFLGPLLTLRDQEPV